MTQRPVARWRDLLSLVFVGCLASPALAAVSREHLVSGGGPATAPSVQLSWAVLGEPFGGRMSGDESPAPPPANAAPQIPALTKDQLVSGGGSATAPSVQLAWAVLGEPLGGRMSGGGFTITGGGSPPPAGNAAPRITTFIPASPSRVYQGTSVALSVTATDSDSDPLQYRFFVDGVVLQDWSTLAMVPWNTTVASFGWHVLRVEVKDATHAVSQESRAFVFWRPPSP